MLSEGLLHLQAEPASKQAEFWIELAEALEPEGLQPHSIEVSFDVLARYFDGTILGISSIIQQAIGKKQELKFQELATVVADRFGFLSTTGAEAAELHAAFHRLCDLVCHGSGDVNGRTATLESVIYAVRRLRLGALLADRAHFQEGNLYCYDYSDRVLSGSFVPSRAKKMRFGLGGWHTVSTVEKQKVAGEHGSLAEYFFSDPSTWPGRVHWVHAHEPGLLVLLALGQQHRLRSHIQGISCRLRGALPQLDVAQHSEELDKLGSMFWSSAVFPFFHLDQGATDALQTYKEWFHQRSKEAKAGSLSTARGTTLPPVVNLGVLHRNLAVFWTGLKDSTVISVATEPLYLGKWESSGPRHSKTVEFILAHCECFVRQWKGRRGGYRLLSQDEEDVEVADMEAEILGGGNEVHRRLQALKFAALAEHNASFEQSFSDLLVQLGETHSPLRMGTHVQLVFRLILHGTSHCLDVIALYEAALVRIKCLLSDPQQPQKDTVMTKVHLAKLELTNMLRMVEPFTEYVMPRLRSEVLPQSRGRGNEDALSSRIALHNMVDIENNMHHFLRECRAQIQVCESLMSEYDMAASGKVNSILNFLTVITFLVMPVQLLTGLYGMNFRGMPELRWEYGYAFFFCIATASTALISVFLLCIYRGAV